MISIEFLEDLKQSTKASVDGAAPKPIIKTDVAIASDDLLFKVDGVEFDFIAAQVAVEDVEKGEWCTEDHNEDKRTVRFYP